MADEDCVLCRVVSGQVSAPPVADTPRIMGVLNTLEPFSRGHCVFFPRKHATNLLEMEDGDLAELLIAIRDVAAKVGADNFNVLSNIGALAGQTVFHAHMHLIPKWSEDEGLVYRREPRHGLEHGGIGERVVLGKQA
jgi:histidine triad (HIT) family protein